MTSLEKCLYTLCAVIILLLVALYSEGAFIDLHI